MHEILYRTFPLKADPKEIQAELDAIAEEDSDSGGGLPRNIRYIDRTLNSYSEAVAFIQSEDQGWYDQLAVKYLDYPDFRKSRKYLELEKKLNEVSIKATEEQCRFYYADSKSEFLGCRTCSSRLRTSYLHNNRCPVCGNDMRPGGVLQHIEALNGKADEIREKLEAEEQHLQEKQRKTAVKKWLVKIEYHT